MQRTDTIKTIEKGRIIAILRGDYAGREVEIVSALADEGVTAAEVTLNSPGAIASIGRLVKSMKSSIVIGAGTVLTADAVAQAADAGACFIVSPNRNIKVIAETRRRDLASFPGCFTPSEIIEALDAGADAVKLFPAIALGAGFVRAMRGPMRDVKMIPTGGVTSQRASEYRAAGAWAIGVGSEMIGPDVLTEGGIQRLRQRAGDFVQAMRDE
jgi:Entner-Doudoroff aldolase